MKKIKKLLTFSGILIFWFIVIYTIALFVEKKIVINTVYQTVSENPYVIPEKVIPVSTSNLYVQYVCCNNEKYKKVL